MTDEERYAILLARSAAKTAIAMKRKADIAKAKAKPSIFDMVSENNSYDVMVIVDQFAELSNTTREGMLGNSRKMPLSTARHVLLYALHEIVGLSTPQLGRIFNRDHSTILNSVWAGRKIVSQNAFLKKHIDEAVEKARIA